MKRCQKTVKKIMRTYITCKRLEEFRIDHQKQHYYQIVNLTEKYFSNVKKLIAVDLYMPGQ